MTAISTPSIGNTLFRQVLGADSFHPAFDALFARGIDPADQRGVTGTPAVWPGREEIARYKAEVNRRQYDLLASIDPANPGHEALVEGWILHLLLEHELMHQETIGYLIHQLPETLKTAPPGWTAVPDGPLRQGGMVTIPAGATVLGSRHGEFPFGWDNEFPAMVVEVAGFAIDVLPVSNGDFLAFLEDGGYRRRTFWDDGTWAWRLAYGVEHPPFWVRQSDGWRLRDLFTDRPLPLSWPVYVTQAEAMAYCRYVGKSLPTEAEWHRAAYGDHPEWAYPWGDGPADASRANADFRHWSPQPVGSYPAGASPYGVLDLIGNGWEWTQTPFAPLPGFQPYPLYPGYSADFFDGRHAVVKGGSPLTDGRLLRRPFRNWFYGHYPYAYMTFRGVGR